jgi:hypothetical protein
VISEPADNSRKSRDSRKAVMSTAILRHHGGFTHIS